MTWGRAGQERGNTVTDAVEEVFSALAPRGFWIEDGQYYALGMDCDGSLLDALSSNIGHLLWSGIVPP